MNQPGLDIDHFRLHVVRATLISLRMWSPASENLLIGTALKESGLKYLRQFKDGPARGLYQIEPATHDDITKRYLKNRTNMRKRVMALVAPKPSRLDQLITNLAYATSIARIVYWRRKEPLPSADDAEAMAAYWKEFYHTYHDGGPGHTQLELQSFVTLYRRYVLFSTT